MMNPIAQNPAMDRGAEDGAHGEQPAEAARHHNFGMGEVDEPEHTVDEGVPEGYQRVKEPVGEAANDERDPDVVVLKERWAAHALRPLPSTLAAG